MDQRETEPAAPARAPEFTEDQLRELCTALERELQKLERSMKTTNEMLQPIALDQTSVGRLSRMDSLQSQGLNRTLHEREQAKLGQLRSAMWRMREGTYGRCVTWGAAIAFERLLVFPESPNCAACGRYA
ncbi:MAG: TraR/DksA family transcriptional regulator [Longimicrobiales bacterium]